MIKWGMCGASFVGAAWLIVSFALVGQSAEWLPVRDVSLEVAKASPLDFSSMLANQPIKAEHRLIINKQGRFARASSSSQPQNLFCASLAWSPASGGFPSHQKADRYARQLARHGYNIARFHFLDASLMAGQERDFDFKPEVLDRIHYLMAALKREGIYWVMDGLTSWRGAYGGYDDRWDPGPDLKLRLHFDKDAQAHWLKLQKAILKRKNPYTGMAPIDDPALALVILANENGLEFDSVVRERAGRAHYDAILRPAFNRWLAARYGSSAKLKRAWGGELSYQESLELLNVKLPENRYDDSVRIRDFQAFFVETERKSAARQSQVLRDLGYKGAISTYNNWATIQTSLSRQDLPVVSMNTYHDWVGGYEPGVRMEQKSSIDDLANYVRMAAAGRWLGKPFFVTEYDHLFWNRYRYEAGIVMPAYAALQDWDGFCRHGHGPIVLEYGEPYRHKRAMLPYAIALDPIARASETLAALLFRRRDVKPAGLIVPFAVNGSVDLGRDMQAREPEILTRLALIGQIGLAKPKDEQALIQKNAGRVGQPRSLQQPWEIWQEIKKSGQLNSSNQTDVNAGRYESVTGEIILDQKSRTVRVVSARSEAVASPATEHVHLNQLSIEHLSTGALVSASVLDEARDLATSRKILLIFATDARNSDMRFRDLGQRIIEDFGRLPVLIRKGKVNLALKAGKRSAAGGWRVSSVDLAGRVGSVIARGQGPVRFRLENDLPDGPTTFFLLERGF